MSRIAMEVIRETVTDDPTPELFDARELPGPAALSDYPLDQQTMERFQGVLEQDCYQQLGELKQLAVADPDAARAAINDVHIKGEAGESLMEAALSQKGEVRNQIPVALEGAAHANRVDLQLVESQANLKQWELTMQDGQLVRTGNYDVRAGDSAAFEVKNGSLEYLRSQVAEGHLQQQIQAGRAIADHSFVVINEDTAQALLHRPAHAAELVQQIHDAGGKLVVDLPGQAVQNALLLS